VEKYGTAGQAKDDNIIRRMLYKKCYKHTIRICYNHDLCTVTIVTPTPLSLTS